MLFKGKIKLDIKQYKKIAEQLRAVHSTYYGTPCGHRFVHAYDGIRYHCGYTEEGQLNINHHDGGFSVPAKFRWVSCGRNIAELEFCDYDYAIIRLVGRRHGIPSLFDNSTPEIIETWAGL